MIPSTTIGMVASHAELIVAVVLKVILTRDVLLFVTVADIPIGHTIADWVTDTFEH